MCAEVWPSLECNLGRDWALTTEEPNIYKYFNNNNNNSYNNNTYY